MKTKISILFSIFIILTVLSCKQDETNTKIGVIAPLSGGSAKYGEDIKRGYDLALKEINKNGGINGKKIRLIYEDSQGKPEQAVSAYRKIIQRNKPIAILGPLWSSSTLAVAPIAEKNKTVILTSGSSSPDISQAGEYIFRNELSDDYGAQKSAELFLDIGYDKIAIIYVNNDFGIGWKNEITKVYENHDGNITTAQAFEKDAKDFRTQLSKIKKTNPKGIMIVGYKEMILILKQYKELNLDAQILSVALFEDEEILEKAGSVAEGAIYTYYGTYTPKSNKPRAKKFTNKYIEEYNTKPGYYAPLGYDALNILALAIKRGGFNSKEIKNELYNIKNFPGVSGKTTFDSNGDVKKPVILKTVKDGNFVRYKKYEN